MTRIEGQVGIGPGWPPSRTKRPVVVSVRYPARLVDGETVVEPVWADVRTTGAGKFAIDDVTPGAILLRIQHGSYVATRALLVPASPETVGYETLVEVDPSSLEPLPPAADAVDTVVATVVADAQSETAGALSAAFAPRRAKSLAEPTDAPEFVKAGTALLTLGRPEAVLERRIASRVVARAR